MNAVSLAVVFGIGAAYTAAIAGSERPAVMAVGLAPIVWIALEAGWRLFRTQR